MYEMESCEVCKHFDPKQKRCTLKQTKTYADRWCRYFVHYMKKEDKKT